MVRTQGACLPQGGEQAAHKALGGRATWERSWRGSAKQSHTALREAEGESPGTRFKVLGAERRIAKPQTLGKPVRGPQRPKGQSDYLSSSVIQKEVPKIHGTELSPSTRRLQL